MKWDPAPSPGLTAFVFVFVFSFVVCACMCIVFVLRISPRYKLKIFSIVGACSFLWACIITSYFPCICSCFWNVLVFNVWLLKDKRKRKMNEKKKGIRILNSLEVTSAGRRELCNNWVKYNNNAYTDLFTSEIRSNMQQ